MIKRIKAGLEGSNCNSRLYLKQASKATCVASPTARKQCKASRAKDLRLYLACVAKREGQDEDVSQIHRQLGVLYQVCVCRNSQGQSDAPCGGGFKTTWWRKDKTLCGLVALPATACNLPSKKQGKRQSEGVQRHAVCCKHKTLCCAVCSKDIISAVCSKDTLSMQSTCCRARAQKPRG